MIQGGQMVGLGAQYSRSAESSHNAGQDLWVRPGVRCPSQELMRFPVQTRSVFGASANRMRPMPYFG